MRFDWDDRKAAANLTKHRVPFTEAKTVFLDAWALDGPDVAHSHQQVIHMAENAQACRDRAAE
jgi:uncharacterized DUF497 family protein